MAGIEARTIQPIPLDQRHGRPRDLFTIWFGSNLMIVTIATGTLATTIFGLTLPAAILAIVVGNAFGGIFMALHAAQGPQLGVPQMVQTRGQFGARGAIAVIGFVAVMDTGFFTSNLVLSAQSLHYAWPAMPIPLGVVLVAAAGTLAALIGHDLIHDYSRVMSWLCGLAIAACFVWLAWHAPAGGSAKGIVTASTMIGAISTSVLWQIAYAPYVSDYSRYLPQDTGGRAAFWSTYWGCVIGSVIPMILGSLLGSYFPGMEVAESLVAATGPFGRVVVPVLTLGIAAASAMSLYCGTLSTITIIETFATDRQAGARTRLAVTLVLALIAIAVALRAGPHFMAGFTDFLLLLLYVMVPWTAINLVDYYLIRHGEYDISAFFAPDGGIYGLYNRAALLCYGVGIVIQAPFVSSALYTGPVARLLGGADVSWIVGLAVVAPLYYAISESARSR